MGSILFLFEKLSFVPSRNSALIAKTFQLMFGDFCFQVLCPTPRKKNVSTSHCTFSDELRSLHMVNLAERITSQLDLFTLGLKVLKIPDFSMDSAATNNKKIQEAAFDVLRDWKKKYSSDAEAFEVLHAGLLGVGWNQLAADL